MSGQVLAEAADSQNEPTLREFTFLHEMLCRLLRWADAFGFSPVRFLRGLWAFPRAIADYRRFAKLNRSLPQSMVLSLSYPCLHDRSEAGGSAKGHYFHQDLLVAQRIFERNPIRHLDIGSRVDGFVAHVAAFRPIEVLDIRPTESRVQNIICRQCDLVTLPPEFVACCDSLSCLHVIEHIGLGRYGDPLDPEGSRRAVENLCRILKPDGTLYLSCPIGRERIEFNAHRVLAVETVLGWVKPQMRLVAFSYVDDLGDLHRSVALTDSLRAILGRLSYGCGIFEFQKTRLS